VGNLRRVADRNYRHALARLGQQVDLTEWWMAPQTVGAVLVFQQNALTFSAALLQAPKYDPAASDAANYGAIGAIIGHEASHFIDPLGAEYEADGRRRRWWTPADSAGFQDAADGLARQFSGYHPFPDLGVDGKLTLSENVADLGGLAAAFDAYRHSLGARASDTAYVRGRTGSSSWVSPGAGGAGSARARSAPSSRATTTRPRCTASPRCETSMRGTTPLMCGRGTSCISRRRRESASGRA
jgi:Predicted metalloendopeptidase